MNDHGAVSGPLTRCQITGSENLELVVDLGHQPPCDALLSDQDLGVPEKTYPLRLMLCPESGSAQLDFVVDGAEIYPKSYPYRAGITPPLVQYQNAFAAEAMRRLDLRPGDFVVDIGSNDGVLLAAFKRLGLRVLGVEPTDTAKIAQAEGIETLQEFFDSSVAKAIVTEYGTPRLVTMTNVFAHMGGLDEVCRGLSILLGKHGVLSVENHYLLDVLEKTQFDTIYHEHIRTYSLRALNFLFPQFGMDIFRAERVGRYGGNIRVWVCRKGERERYPEVNALLQEEIDKGLFNMSSWRSFRDRIMRNRSLCMEFLFNLQRRGQTIAGVSAPGRCSTLVNFYGITPDLLPYLGELPGSLKIGKYLPGKHIPIVSNNRIVKEQPDYVLLMAWHYADVIVERLAREGVRSRPIVPLPLFGKP